MAAFALDSFERQAEAFRRSRAWREYHFQSGRRPGRGLLSLYDEDFADFTSTDFFLDLQAANEVEPRQLGVLTELLASAYVEGNTRERAARAGGLEARTSITFEDDELAWRTAPRLWTNIELVPRRHELAEIWRSTTRTELNPVLERWQEEVRGALVPLSGDEWLTFWAQQRGVDLGGTAKLAESLLRLSHDVYAHALGVYFGQLELPLDDAWSADADSAFRAPRFDVVFTETTRMPVLVRALRDLGIDLEAQTELSLEKAAGSDLRTIVIGAPDEVHVVVPFVGGWQDLARCLRGLGSAQHSVHTDRTLPFWQRELGDATPGLAYGLLLEGLVRDRVWLTERVEYAASDDFRVISTIAWLYRVRKLAALTLYEQRLWAAEPGTATAADFEEALSSQLHVRHFAVDYLLGLLNTPWSTLRSSVELRAECFAAQLRLWLKREFDEEWWRSGRASNFLKRELWRAGKRYTADELLGFMGF
ncbi:MAG: hypothetical protein JOY61_04990, partial [Chloroflexi bacterium]|nr:hypothetical protein [Chloroflexota bacterium]